MKAFKRSWLYHGLPDGPEFDGLMDTAKWRVAVDWFLDQMLAASLELRRMQEHYDDELNELRDRELLQRSGHHLNQLKQREKSPSTGWIQRIEARYAQILKKGYRTYRERMPCHPQAPRSGPQTKRDTGHNLLHRLHYYRSETLRFLHDPRVPFTHNRAEQDLRMAKVKQKISGCFRSFGGGKAFFRIRSFISTMMKQNRNPYIALGDLFKPLQLDPT